MAAGKRKTSGVPGVIARERVQVRSVKGLALVLRDLVVDEPSGLAMAVVRNNAVVRKCILDVWEGCVECWNLIIDVEVVGCASGVVMWIMAFLARADRIGFIHF